MKKKISLSICIGLIVIFLLAYYIDVKGKIISIKELTIDEKKSIVSTYGINLDTSDVIESFDYMTYAHNSFFVLKIRVTDMENFKENNADEFEEFEILPDENFWFPSKRYKPKEKETVYISDGHIYISTWSFEDSQISDLYFDIIE